MEASDFMDLIEAGQQRMLLPEFEQVGASVAQSCDIRASRAAFKLHNYEEALQVDSTVTGEFSGFNGTARQPSP
jgi:hypothetical protein